jgi:hypothetical protein
MKKRKKHDDVWPARFGLKCNLKMPFKCPNKIVNNDLVNNQSEMCLWTCLQTDSRMSSTYRDCLSKTNPMSKDWGREGKRRCEAIKWRMIAESDC